ncbi:hypothetical protein D7V97_22740 [Corallococcus sp. CA053C]|uniref:hypothetical protein n=1 Tax=Corallococcus sp. CA053C TaxID=2316732 RepID=UPI000EA045AB|nr:hypothetical protein [Corallococcus sp. CA053C]RKH06290.1 hypothetical protein D7V97_22740 [Corallococcus sp. CA053C]
MQQPSAVEAQAPEVRLVGRLAMELEEVGAWLQLHFRRREAHAAAVEYVKALLERSIALLPQPAPLYNRMGMIVLNHQRDYTRASAFFQKAADLEPENSVYTMNLYSVLCLTAEATNAGQKKKSKRCPLRSGRLLAHVLPLQR